MADDVVRTGHPRNRPLGLLLIPLTLGLYYFYWLYRAHAEVFDHHALERDGRRDPAVWLVLGLAFPPLLIVYVALMAANVAHAQRRLGLRRLRPWLPVAAAFVPSAAVVAFLVTNLVLMMRLDAKTLLPPELSPPLLVVAADLIGHLAVYAILQTHINRIWKAGRAQPVPQAAVAEAARQAVGPQSRPSTPPASRVAILR